VKKNRVDEALVFYRKAHALAPENVKYAYWLAVYLDQIGDTAEAVRVLRQALTNPAILPQDKSAIEALLQGLRK